jgi:Cysteine-rich CWC
MLPKLIELIQPEKRAPRECEACGQPFRCGASLTGCWCFSIKLDEATRQQLRAQYTRCLCRDCLEALARPKET